ncbi:liprin-beta 1 isoform X4 [Leptinotarsa decemlineata]|uniref:liprin-beta 1 isoform X4 n=1 Tax=Leptinotarsa decemlineata TaxID=7539 RepID=UPI003D307469
MESTGTSSDKSSTSSEDEDEVTFLLRFKPAPTPPVRRKNNSLPKNAPKGWDVLIERKEPPSPPLTPPVSSRIRRFSLDSRRNTSFSSSRQFESVKDSVPAPPLPPKYLPSAPPQDLVENLHWYPKPYIPVPYYNAHIAVSSAFSSSYPNLRYAENGGSYVEHNVPAPLSPTSPRREFYSPQLYGCGENFAETYRNSGRSDLLTSYSVVPPRIADPSSCPRSPPPIASKPPKPLPRTSLLLEKGEKRAEVSLESLPLGNNVGPGEQDEKLRKIQYEKENLALQVQVLTDQIEAQSDKITDLEKMLQEKKQLLSEAEDKLQREVLSRSSLETQKLELMSIMSELKLQHAALERENLELRNSQYNNNSEIKKPPVMPRMASQPTLTSTPVQLAGNQQPNVRMSPAPSPVSVAGNSPRRIETASPVPQENQQPKTPPANFKRQIDIQYGSLPRQQFLANGTNNVVDSNANPANGSKKGVAFGRGLYSLVGGRHRGFSVPNLAETEKVVIEDGTSESPGSPALSFNKSKGIKKIFGKIKRSGSGNLEDIPGLSEFQRGGVRATAAARLGWSEPQISVKPDKPFSDWDTENICDWLQDLGLDSYIQEARRWVQNGQQLQEAPISEIEKELNIKNPLHRKKLQLALIDTQANGSSDLYLTQAGKLDTAWVLRWLDDTGLPQHKENFLINRVDGRVLHRLTIDDLALLHVTSMLHVASIKRGIQVLRENNYEPACLQRRSLPDDPPQPTPKQISLWTTHRVMEWLRAVDLAEYAPNLRGAGVHGGLMVRETKFNAELLASLLAIPPGKTLLRRHLNTHFKELLGKDIIQDKREAESTMGYIPLTPSSKLKVPKKSQFSLKRKKSKGEADYGDLVCPLNPDKTGELGSALNSSVGMMRTESLEEEGVSHLVEYKSARSLPASVGNSPIPQRHV